MNLADRKRVSQQAAPTWDTQVYPVFRSLGGLLFNYHQICNFGDTAMDPVEASVVCCGEAGFSICAQQWRGLWSLP